MREYKKVATLFVSFLILSSFCCSVDAFKYTNKYKNKIYDEENRIKRNNIKTKSIKEQEGFVYSMSVKRPKNAPGNFVDFFNKCFMFMLRKKTPYKEQEGINIESFFRNCNYEYNNDSYSLEQFVFNNNKNKIKKLKNFYKNSMADKDFSKYFNEYNFGDSKYIYGYKDDKDKIILDKDEYERFLKKYCDRLFERFRDFSFLLKQIYEKKNLDRLEKELKLYYEDTSHSEDVLSFMNQSEEMKEIIKAMLKIIRRKKEEKTKIKSLKKKMEIEDDGDYEYNSHSLFNNYYDDDYFHSHKYNSDSIYRRIFGKDDDYDFEDFNYSLKNISKYGFKRCLDIYYGFGIKNIRNLKKIGFEDFKESVRSVDFKNNIEKIVRKTEEVSGTIETLEKNR